MQESRYGLMRGQIPQDGRAIITAGSEGSAIRAESDCPHNVVVPGQGDSDPLSLCQIPQNYLALVIARTQKLSIRAECQSIHTSADL